MRLGILGQRLSCAALVQASYSSSEEFRFGLLSDVQYCDCDDAMNFAGTEMRRYRCLDGTREAAAAFSRQKVAFAAQLGDLIDGQNAGKYGAGLKTGRTSESALATVVAALGNETKYVHSVGNHELYSWSLDQLCSAEHPLQRGNHEIARGGKTYFSFEIGSWLFVQLNPYQESLMTGHDELLRRHNPRVLDASPSKVDYFQDLAGDKLRFVPFNGACGRDQRAWLRNLLSRTDKHVVIFTHIPLCPGAASWRNVAYDSPELLGILDEFAHKVVVVFAGHSHRGGVCQTNNGIYHLTIPALLTHRSSFGIVSAHENRLELLPAGDFREKVLSGLETLVMPTAKTTKMAAADTFFVQCAFD